MKWTSRINCFVICFNEFCFFFCLFKADIEVAFDLPDLENDTDALDSEEVDQATLIDGYSASVKGVYGPFGLLALASNDLSEHTAIFLELFVVGMDMRFWCAAMSK